MSTGGSSDALLVPPVSATAGTNYLRVTLPPFCTVYSIAARNATKAAQHLTLAITGVSLSDTDSHIIILKDDVQVGTYFLVWTGHAKLGRYHRAALITFYNCDLSDQLNCSVGYDV